MPRPSATELEEWAPGNYAAGDPVLEPWQSQPRRTPARRPVEAASGFVPEIPFHAGGVNDYVEQLRLWMRWAVQLAIGLHAGDGSDGDVTIAGTTNLTRDMYYDHLVVDGTLNTNGFRVFARSSIVVNVGGTIRVNAPGAGTNGGAGTAGTGGAVPSNGTLGMGFAGGNGGTAGNPGVAGTNATAALGGAGGPGGQGDTAGGPQLGGTAGTVTVPTAVVGGRDVVRALPQAITGRDLAGTILRGGSGGGGGGGGRLAGTNSGGGGGGAGGGVLLLVSPDIQNDGEISSRGGNGGNGADNGSSSGGGGGPGGGGAVICITGHYHGSGTRTAAAGTPGTRGVLAAGATDGGAGVTGIIVTIDAAA
jgi:hypothetical protein